MILILFKFILFNQFYIGRHLNKGSKIIFISGCQTSANHLDGGQIRFPKGRSKTPPPPEGKKNISLQVNPMMDLVYKSNNALNIITPSQLPVKDVTIIL